MSVRHWSCLGSEFKWNRWGEFMLSIVIRERELDRHVCIDVIACFLTTLDGAIVGVARTRLALQH
jgi:hypothetical protein